MDSLKERINSYWTRRAPSFAEQRARELSSGKRGKWLAEFDRWLPGGRRLDILDIGTGTGFFALLLSERGHRVTGIDLSAEMVRYAEQSAGRAGADAVFRVMDAERPDFAPGSFDALVTRNLTWALPHLEEAYRAWGRLLKPGGVLVNFDADYCRRTADAVDAETELPENHAHKQVPQALIEENDRITLELSAYQRPRPQWDVGLLLDAGFERVTVDTGVWERVYAEKDEFY
ncbi:MAG: class I SAM-dependent methyltransferase, partial [Oscillospiraceae bacterium]|nr:class I SAM-dependent methyltransferase [Oscillospiraceae bacterium]